MRSCPPGLVVEVAHEETPGLVRIICLGPRGGHPTSCPLSKLPPLAHPIHMPLAPPNLLPMHLGSSDFEPIAQRAPPLKSECSTGTRTYVISSTGTARLIHDYTVRSFIPRVGTCTSMSTRFRTHTRSGFGTIPGRRKDALGLRTLPLAPSRFSLQLAHCPYPLCLELTDMFCPWCLRSLDLLSQGLPPLGRPPPELKCNWILMRVCLATCPWCEGKS